MPKTGLPTDNLFFRFFLQAWPMILAVVATVLLVYKWLRPKFSGEDLQRGLLRQGILTLIDDGAEQEDDPELRYWLGRRRNIPRSLSSTTHNETSSRIRYRDHVTISLLWSLFWIGAFVFLTIRILLNPYYYGGEAYFLGYFAIYITIGLISYFKR